MSFTNPGGLWFSLLAIPIIAFHLYRGKVRKKEVSSLLLWRMMDSDDQTSSTMRVLQRYVSLILNLGALLFITLAISEPQIQGITKPKEKYVLILDNSLSMKTREAGGTRFEIAKNEALNIIHSLGRKDEVKVLDINGVVGEINKMEHQPKRLELNELFDMAKRVAGDAKIIFISDGSGDEKLGELIKSYGINYIMVGSAKKNFAIVNGNLTKGAGDKRFTLFLRLLIPQTGNLKISIDDEELGIFELQKEFSFSIPEDKSGLLTAQILSKDALLEDNTAYFVLPPLVKPPISYFYSEKPNKFVIDIINTLGKEGDIDLEKSFSAHISKFDEANLEGFFTIIENCKLQQMPKEGTFLFINSGIESGRRVKDVKSLRIYKTSLTDMVEFDKLIIKETQVSDIRSYEKPLLEVESSAIAKVGNIGRTAYIWLGFSLEDSDFALHPAFPIFFKNVLNWAMIEAHCSNENTPINFFDEKESNITPIEAPSTPLQIQSAKWYQDLPLENLSVAVAMLLLIAEWLLYYRGLI